jgi:hypothetical protein
MKGAALLETDRFHLETLAPQTWERVIEGVDVREHAWWPAPSGTLAAPDGNRSAHLVEPRIEWADRSWLVGIKGVGALTPPYPDDGAPRTDRFLADERWLGESPYGGQGAAAATRGAAITRLAPNGDLAGFRFCPIVALAGVPEELADRGRNQFWYRKHRGPTLQEIRLLPSDVRLFHESRFTLGQHTDAVLAAFGVADEPAFESFLESFLRTGMAALTLWARSLRSKGGVRAGFDLQAVWFDKDSVIAPDGSLFFTDLEGLDWVPEWPSAEERIHDQLDRSLYELYAGADALLRWSEKRWARPRTRRERRMALAARLELALDSDPFGRIERGSEGLDWILFPGGEPPAVRVRLVDFEGA